LKPVSRLHPLRRASLDGSQAAIFIILVDRTTGEVLAILTKLARQSHILHVTQ